MIVCIAGYIALLAVHCGWTGPSNGPPSATDRGGQSHLGARWTGARRRRKSSAPPSSCCTGAHGAASSSTALKPITALRQARRKPRRHRLRFQSLASTTEPATAVAGAKRTISNDLTSRPGPIRAIEEPSPCPPSRNRYRLARGLGVAHRPGSAGRNRESLKLFRIRQPWRAAASAFGAGPSFTLRKARSA